MADVYEKHMDDLIEGENNDFLAMMEGKITSSQMEDRALIRHIKIIGQGIEEVNNAITTCIEILRSSGLVRLQFSSGVILMNDYLTETDKTAHFLVSESKKIVQEGLVLENKKSPTIEDSYHIIDLGNRIITLEGSIKKLAKELYRIIQFNKKALEQLASGHHNADQVWVDVHLDDAELV